MQSCIELLKNEKKNLEQHVQDLERVQLEAIPDQLVTPIPISVLPVEENVGAIIPKQRSLILSLLLIFKIKSVLI